MLTSYIAVTALGEQGLCYDRIPTHIEKAHILIAQDLTELLDYAPSMFRYLLDVSLHSANQRLGLTVRTPKEISRTDLEIKDELGKGYFGKVSKALYDAHNGLPAGLVAVKSLQEVQESASKQLMLREASLMAGLEHPNLVELIGIVSIGEPVYVVLELCEHGALSEYLKSHQLSESDRVQIIDDVANGLGFLAALGIVHRDVAARNVLLATGMRAKVSDYGMSRILGSKGYYRSRGALMSVRWTAPESLEREIFSEQSDVWSFGVLMYEIWSNGAVPYEDLTEKLVWISVTGGLRLPKPKDCPDSVYKIMQSCWAEAGQRPPFKVLINLIRKLAGKSQLEFLPLTPLSSEVVSDQIVVSSPIAPMATAPYSAEVRSDRAMSSSMAPVATVQLSAGVLMTEL